METETDNELIAEFMGYKLLAMEKGRLYKAYQKEGDDTTLTDYRGHTYNIFKYETSWNWLMPVVEKIDGLYHVAFPGNEEFIRRLLSKEELLDGPYMDVIALPLATPINEVYTSVLAFIKWYNNQKENGNRNS